MNGLCGPSSGTVSSIPNLQERTNSGTTATGSPIRRGVITAQYTMSSPSDSMRKSRSQGGKKLQKCLSTASYGEELSFNRPQMTPLSHSLLMTRQYCSFGSTTSQFYSQNYNREKENSISSRKKNWKHFFVSSFFCFFVFSVLKPKNKAKKFKE